MLGAFCLTLSHRLRASFPHPASKFCEIRSSIFFLHPKWKGPGVKQVKVRPLVCDKQTECLSSPVPVALAFLSCLPLLPFWTGEMQMAGCRCTIQQCWWWTVLGKDDRFLAPSPWSSRNTWLEGTFTWPWPETAFSLSAWVPAAACSPDARCVRTNSNFPSLKGPKGGSSCYFYGTPLFM